MFLITFEFGICMVLTIILLTLGALVGDNLETLLIIEMQPVAF